LGSPPLPGTTGTELGPTGIPRRVVPERPIRPSARSPRSRPSVFSTGWTLADMVDEFEAHSGAKGHRFESCIARTLKGSEAGGSRRAPCPYALLPLSGFVVGWRASSIVLRVSSALPESSQEMHNG